MTAPHLDGHRYAVATFASRTDVFPNQFEATWPDLVQTLSEHRAYPSKHDVWLWSPALYREGARRGRDGVISVSLFVGDIDDGTSGEQMRARLTMLGSSFLVVSTWSHRPEHPKLRVVIPLSVPIPVEAYDQVWQSFNEYLFEGRIDGQTKDPSRMFYGPSCPSERLGGVYVGYV